MGMSENFVHLHNHSSYSLLDGAALVDEYVKLAAQDGQPAIASTDHGNLHALPDYEKACNEHGLKFIPGCEVYQARHSQSDRPKTKKKTDGDDSETGKLYYHTLVFARNQAGYENLMRLQTNAWLEGMYYKNRVDWSTLEQFSEGLMATSACLGSIIQQDLLKNNIKTAEESTGKFVDIFGKDDFFIELQRHGIPEQDKTNPMLIQIAKKFDLKIIATNDNHYASRSDNASHDCLLCCQTGSILSDPDRFKFSSDQHYLKSAHEMRHLFREIPEACDNTLWLADRVEPITIINKGTFHLPKFKIKDERYKHMSSDDYLAMLVNQGCERKYPEITAEIRSRIDYELAVISSAGMSDYFLITWDIINFAKSEGIMIGPGRGSAAGAVIAYGLDITGIDPIKYDLMFERFYNPDRKGLPDIDIDMDTRFRQHLINYCIEVYGDDRVCQIVTFSQIKDKTAIRSAARVLGFSPAEGAKYAKLTPPAIFGKSAPLKEVLKEKPVKKWKDHWKGGQELRDEYLLDPNAQLIYDTAQGLEGLVDHTGVHAAAVIISDDHLNKYIPLMRKKRKNHPGPGPVTSSFDMGYVEDAGLVKMDFLGLKNLDIISDTLAMVNAGREDHEKLVLGENFDDAETYRKLTMGDGIGVFQLESSPMRALMKQIAPDNFGDIAALIALYRPGPMGMNMHTEYAKRKHGLSPITGVHPDADDILDETYKIMVYQEQMQKIAQRFAGFTGGESDTLRKITGKKLPDQMAEQKDKFITGCRDNNYTDKIANTWWDLIEPFASYSFNKSHSYAYGAISYWTAYLKTHHPVEYMSAILTAEKTDIAKAGIYLVEADRMGIQILLPDVNISGLDFTPDGPNIRFGLSAIRDVGEKPAQAIIDARGNGFKNYQDLKTKVSGRSANKSVMFALTASGAFDNIDNRGGLLEVFDAAFESSTQKQKAAEAGVQSFLDLVDYDDSVVVPDVTLEDAQVRELERKFLGMSVTSNPLTEWGQVLERRAKNTLEEVSEMEDDAQVEVTCVVTDVKPWKTKAGKEMATLTVGDLTGVGEVLLFAQTWAKIKPQLDQAITLKGKISDDGDKILGMSVKILDPSLKGAQEAITQNPHAVLPEDLLIELKSSDLSEEKVTKLQSIASNSRFIGNDDIIIRVEDLNKDIRLNIKVDKKNPLLRSNLRTLFGIKKLSKAER